MLNYLEVNSVSKNFGGFKALQDVSLQIPEGSIFGLLGPNGAGKTTLIRIINQITMPDTGTVKLGGDLLHPSHIAAIGYMPEERGLYKSMKVGEQVLYLAQLKGLSKTEAKKNAKYWFDKLEISPWWNKKIQELSKGQAQKIQFVTTVVHNPKLLIFDEPFSGFDPINANLIKDEILALRQNGATVIFSTHRMESVEELCDHIALINKSKKILDGEINAIKRAYRNNTFEVGLSIADNESRLAAVQQQIISQFNAEDAEFDTFEKVLNFKIVLGTNATPNPVIQHLLKMGELRYFNEVIPSVNDIFIKSVGAINE